MKCPICKHGETRADKATVTLERGGLTLVVRSVPAQVCQSCGEEYIDEAITTRVLQQAEELASNGVQIEIREFVAA